MAKPQSQAWADSHLGAVSRREQFGVHVYDDSGESRTNEYVEVAWNWMDLSTIGDCACWGVAGDDRGWVDISPETNRLYEMGPHNVDYALQSLSLVLGAATLAFATAQYEGKEDILANAKWRS